MKTLKRFWVVHYCLDHSQREHKCYFKEWDLGNGKTECWVIDNEILKVVTPEEGNNYFKRLKERFMYKFIVVKII